MFDRKIVFYSFVFWIYGSPIPKTIGLPTPGWHCSAKAILDCGLYFFAGCGLYFFAGFFKYETCFNDNCIVLVHFIVEYFLYLLYLSFELNKIDFKKPP